MSDVMRDAANKGSHKNTAPDATVEAEVVTKAKASADRPPTRCPWCEGDPLYVRYHDEEWGKLVTDDKTMFEFVTLESAQAGLSWLTILKRRENYRQAFADFDVQKVADFDEDDVQRLMQDEGIIRNQRKIRAATSNAQAYIKVQAEFGSFCNYLLSFFPDGRPIVNRWQSTDEIPAVTPLAEQISKDMKKRGFSFFGPTICYAHLQATGYINDHLLSCDFR